MKKIVAMLFVGMMVGAGMLRVVPVNAETKLGDDAVCKDSGVGLSEEEKKMFGCGETKKAPKVIQDIINVVLSFMGILAVISVVYGGVNYVLSQGDAGKVKRGKDAIIYGVVGLIVALSAYAIVNFVLAGVFGGTSEGGSSSSNGSSSDSGNNNGDSGTGDSGSGGTGEVEVVDGDGGIDTTDGTGYDGGGASSDSGDSGSGDDSGSGGGTGDSGGVDEPGEPIVVEVN